MTAENTSWPALPYYKVEYSNCPPLLKGYNHRPLNAEEITESCELLLATAKLHACPYWMLDGRSHQQHQPQSLHDWMQEEYFPRVKRELGQQLCVAFLVPEAVWAGLPDRGYENPPDWPSLAAHMGWFVDEPSALDWLAKQRAWKLV